MNHKPFKHGLVISWIALTANGCANLGDPHAPVEASSAHALGRVAPVAIPSTETVEAPAFHHLKDYLVHAALQSSELKAAFNQWKAALERIPQVKALPDPMLNYGYFIREVETRVGPQNHRLGLAQRFPWFGTRALRGDKASVDAAIARERYEGTKWRIFEEVKRGYYEFYYLRRATEITRENIALLKSIESVAQTKVRAGGGTGAVVKAQLEIGKLEDQLDSLQNLRKPIMAQLNAAIGLSPEHPLPWPGEIRKDVVSIDRSDLMKRLDATNPELRALSRQIQADDRSIQLARKAYYPDITLGMDYIATGETPTFGISDRGKDPVMAMFSLNLPVWRSKLHAARREAELKKERSMLLLEDTKNQLTADVEMAWFEFQDAERKTELYRDTLSPLAESALNVAQGSYEAGRSDFLEWVDAQRLLLELQLSYERALADRAQSLAKLEALIGMDLTQTNLESQKTTP